MATLYRYFKDLWKVAVVALVLAAINQIFSLLDPLIFRHIIDSYATRYREYSSPQFIRGVGLLVAAAVGVALGSRIAKNFQDYFVNVITQKVGARIYTDGVRHSLDLPYTLFEDQRSGETLGKLQRVRSDVEKFIALLVNMVFTTLIGLAFVTIYAAKVHWSIAPAYLLSFYIVVFHFWPAAGTGKCRQRVSRDGSIARQFRRDFENADGAKARAPGRAAFT